MNFGLYALSFVLCTWYCWPSSLCLNLQQSTKIKAQSSVDARFPVLWAACIIAPFAAVAVFTY
jgi:hypothetical protein